MAAASSDLRFVHFFTNKTLSTPTHKLYIPQYLCEQIEDEAFSKLILDGLKDHFPINAAKHPHAKPEIIELSEHESYSLLSALGLIIDIPRKDWGNLPMIDADPDSKNNLEYSCRDDFNVVDKQMWEHEAIMEMVRIRKSMEDTFNYSDPTNAKVWNKISVELQKKGYIYSANKCAKKFNSLKRRYRIINNRYKDSDSFCIEWRYYNLMHSLFANDDASPKQALKVPVEESVCKIRTNKYHRDMPVWFKDYVDEQNQQHFERMKLERERLNILRKILAKVS